MYTNSPKNGPWQLNMMFAVSLYVPYEIIRQSASIQYIFCSPGTSIFRVFFCSFDSSWKEEFRNLCIHSSCRPIFLAFVMQGRNFSIQCFFTLVLCCSDVRVHFLVHWNQFFHQSHSQCSIVPSQRSYCFHNFLVDLSSSFQLQAYGAYSVCIIHIRYYKYLV